jgi:hypothetical protein
MGLCSVGLECLIILFLSWSLPSCGVLAMGALCVFVMGALYVFAMGPLSKMLH